MQTKRIGRTLVSLLAVGLIRSVVFIGIKNGVIAQLQRDKLLVESIYETHSTIILLKEKKLEDCALLGVNLPVGMLDICPIPDMG